MNLYLHRNGRNGLGRLSVQVTDAEGDLVGYVTTEVADFLVVNGIALDLT